MDKRKVWMSKFTGKKFYFYDPKPEDICIEDIAHSLAMKCRFNGHCSQFYSVGLHSIIVSKHVHEHNALHGLLHDASEAYLSDIVSPLKATLDEYKKLEHNIQTVIYKKYRISPYLGEENVKLIDTLLLRDEIDFLMEDNDFSVPPDKLDVDLYKEGIGQDMRVTETRFLKRFIELTNG